ncbi:hypothetical protein FRC03_003401 [Tulasnella sp. 419]|nr:hypothetical protein FRC03_003401 [Tulasnella sp. 419]
MDRPTARDDSSRDASTWITDQQNRSVPTPPSSQDSTINTSSIDMVTGNQQYETSETPCHPVAPQVTRAEDARALLQLAAEQLARFEEQDDEQLLDNAIENLRTVLSIWSPNHPSGLAALRNFATCLRLRFERHGGPYDLIEAIYHYNAIIDHLPPLHPLHVSNRSHLADLLMARFCQQGLRQDIDSAISHQLRSLELTLENHPDRIPFWKKLASFLTTRFERYGDQQDLQEAIYHYGELLSILPEDDPDRPFLVDKVGHLRHNLANPLLELGDRPPFPVANDPIGLWLFPIDPIDVLPRHNRLNAGGFDEIGEGMMQEYSISRQYMRGNVPQRLHERTNHDTNERSPAREMRKRPGSYLARRSACVLDPRFMPETSDTKVFYSDRDARLSFASPSPCRTPPSSNAYFPSHYVHPPSPLFNKFARLKSSLSLATSSILSLQYTYHTLRVRPEPNSNAVTSIPLSDASARVPHGLRGAVETKSQLLRYLRSPVEGQILSQRNANTSGSVSFFKNRAIPSKSRPPPLSNRLLQGAIISYHTALSVLPPNHPSKYTTPLINLATCLQLRHETRHNDPQDLLKTIHHHSTTKQPTPSHHRGSWVLPLLLTPYVGSFRILEELRRVFISVSRGPSLLCSPYLDMVSSNDQAHGAPSVLVENVERCAESYGSWMLLGRLVWSSLWILNFIMVGASVSQVRVLDWALVNSYPIHAPLLS